MSRFYSVLLVIAILYSCNNKQEPIVTFIESPAIGSSSESNLHVSQNNALLLSWINNGIESELQFATLKDGETWTQSTTVAKGKDWFVNWADFPSIQAFDNSSLATFYLDKSAEDTYAYDVKISLSNDAGKNWNNPFSLHEDNTQTEHGFVSMDALTNNNLLAVWLDGRQYQYHKQDSTIAKQMTLRSAEISSNGDFIYENEIDKRVCDCCQTDLVSNASEAIAVYRNRSDNEVRDIYYSKYKNGIWTTPKAVYNDNWNIMGCPVNGPRIDAMSETLGLVWFTLNDTNVPTIKHSFSTDFGETFKSPSIISENTPLGRVDIKMLNENTSVITWMDIVSDKTVIYLQKIHVDGTKSEKIEVTETSDSRSSGFPRLEIFNNDAYITWTEASEPPSIKVAKVDLNQIQ